VSSSSWKSRIVGHSESDPGDLVAHDRNWRGHPESQQKALVDALDSVGWVQTVVVNDRTGTIVDGHLRVALAMARGVTSIPVQHIDIDKQEEKLVLATLDPLAGLAATDEGALKGLLSDVSDQLGDELGRMTEDITGHRPDPAPAMPTQDEIDRHEITMAERYENRQPDLVDVTCEDCGYTFAINRTMLRPS
jgi:ParB-like chromosome segregation protein Spo0J